MARMLTSLVLICLRNAKLSCAFVYPLCRYPITISKCAFSATAAPACSWPNLRIRGDSAFVSRLTNALNNTSTDALARLPVPIEMGLFDGQLGVQLLGTNYKPLCIDFTTSAIASRASDASVSTLVRAVKGRGNAVEVVYDMTAGLGRDAATMARAGMHVVMFERHGILSAMLSDALERLKSADPILAAKIELHPADSLQLSLQTLRRLQIPPPDAVYLDPMYAARTKTAKVKKEMQILHLLLGSANSQEDESLFRTARGLQPKRIVVKRQINARPLVDNIKASGAIKGSTQRFDIYTTIAPQTDEV